MAKNANTVKIQPAHNSLTDYTSTVTMATDTISIGSISGGVVGATGSTIYDWDSNNIWTSGSNGSSAIDWGNLTINSSPAIVTNSGQLDLRGDAADIKINGRSLMDAIEKLEERLNVLVPNPELEKEWDELRELGERYRELEKKCKEKGEMWKKLKQMPPPEVE